MRQSHQRSAENKPNGCSPAFADVRAGSAARVHEHSKAFADVQNRSSVFAQDEFDKTNPTHAANLLTPRQLAAARMMIRGAVTNDIAKHLSTTPQTITRWRRTPQFAAELRRLHEMLAMRQTTENADPRLATPLAASVVTRRAPNAAGLKVASARGSTREEQEKQRRFDAMMDRLLAPPNLGR